MHSCINNPLLFIQIGCRYAQWQSIDQGITHGLLRGARLCPVTIRHNAQARRFSFGMRNYSPATISTRLTEWHAIGADGQRGAVRPPEAWEANWQRAGITNSLDSPFVGRSFRRKMRSIREIESWVWPVKGLPTTFLVDL